MNGWRGFSLHPMRNPRESITRPASDSQQTGQIVYLSANLNPAQKWLEG